MKENQPSIEKEAEIAVSWGWQTEGLPEPKCLRDAVAASSEDEIRTRSSKIVLLFLDLARTTGDAAYLEIANSGAKHLAHTWERLAASPRIAHGAINPSYTNSLSRSAFALAEAWKVTKNPVYRNAGLSIIRHFAERESPTGRGLDAVRKGGER